MIKINLLAEAKRPTAARRTRAAGQLSGEQLSQYLLVGAILLAVAGCGLWWWTLYSESRKKDAEIQDTQRQIQQLAEYIERVDRYKNRKAELEHKIEVIKSLKANQQVPVLVMDEISKALPELLWLTKMEVNLGSVLVEGKAFNTNAIATFTENLYPTQAPGATTRKTFFHEPDFKSTQREGPIYSFQIFLRYDLRTADEGSEEDGAVPAATGAAGG